MIYSCCDSRRRDVIAGQSAYNVVYNGIDFLEVSSDQLTLTVHFIQPLAPGQLKPENVLIEGGERIRNIAVTSAREGLAISPPEDPHVLVATVNQAGDFSTYRLRLVDANDHTRPPAGFDAVLSQIDFSFKVGCPSDFDCQPQNVCPPAPPTRVDISYLAKDYASFLQLMLDRMAKIMPQWQETSPADVGMMLVELLAFVGDYLSYQQDAVATEAYLGTARRRVSVRRHVRLLDYPMHDGCNARTWVQFRVSAHASMKRPPAGGTMQLLTRVNLRDVAIPVPSARYTAALQQKPQVFELLNDIELFPEHNRMSFYTWGSTRCCLPQGATCAWLRGSFPNLKPGQILVLQEALGPETGVPGDADPTHRCAVRLTKVTADSDPLGGQFDSPPTANAVAVTRIDWATDDALPFPLCVSTNFADVSVALGNVVAADHGQTIAEEDLDSVPEPNPALETAGTANAGGMYNPVAPAPQPARFRPELHNSPVTFADPYDDTIAATAVLGKRALDELLPQITLGIAGQPDRWQPQRDLLASHADSKDFVVEVENDGSAFLRFGDGVFGALPDPGTVFQARYRVMNGIAGNIGQDSLFHLATDDATFTDPSNPVVISLTNPLAGTGGLDPQPLEEVRQQAPYAFRVQQRAVTEEDYADIAQRIDSSVSRARATFRWTGSWRTVFIAADRKGGAAVDDLFRTGMRNGMEYYRMAGHDVEVDDPQFVSLEIEMKVCVKPDYFASDIEGRLLEVLSNRKLPDGTTGVFHPDNFTFGQPVYLSPIYAAVQSTGGVESVKITKFQRQGVDSSLGLQNGVLEMDRAEIARLDNDPNFPEHGVLRLHMTGGR